MENRTVAVLDLTDCKYLGELHKRIKESLLFPNHYGANWDAFWDCMQFESPVDRVQIKGEHTMPQELKVELETMHKLLQECKEERKKLGDVFHYEIID